MGFNNGFFGSGDNGCEWIICIIIIIILICCLCGGNDCGRSRDC